MKATTLKNGMIICRLLIAVSLIVISGCNKKEEMDFGPATGGPYSFVVEPRNGGARTTYNLRTTSALVTKNQYGTYWFMLKGKDEAKNANITLSGVVPERSSGEFNLGISTDGSSTLYKDCNFGRIEVTEGSDTKGSFTRIAIAYNECMTATLRGARFSAEPYFQLNAQPIIIYDQEQ